VFTVDDLSGDEHAHSHIMLVEIPSGAEQSLLMPGNPIKVSRVAKSRCDLSPPGPGHPASLI
jgi:crotonobetainyl-CoA:carnitine CoA-transferase CaiB-like acyl-CoA transferase